MVAKKKTMRELLAEEKTIILPEVYDFRSQRAAEFCGFKATLLSSTEFACGYTGIPDLGVITQDEEVFISERISRASTIPLCIDAEDGFGGPLNTYYTAYRLTHLGGAGGILLTDEINGCPASRQEAKQRVTNIKVALAKIRAAAEGVAGTDSIVIARTDLNILKDFDETVERCNLFYEAGADVVFPLTLNDIKGCRDERHEFLKKFSDQVPGYKWYPDLSYTDGEPDVDLDVIADMGFCLIGVHYLLESAMLFMIDVGLNIMKNKDNCYVRTIPTRFPEACKLIAGHDLSQIQKGGKWWELEKRFWGEENMDESTTYRVLGMSEEIGDFTAGVRKEGR